MKREYVVILFVLIIVTLVANVVFLYNPPQTQNSPKTQNSTQSNSVVSVTGNSINSQINSTSQTNSILSNELSKHNLKSDCWISYKGKVYDITAFLPKHPGSADAIAPYCGTSSEFEEAFSDQHGTSKVSILLKEGTYKGDLK